MKASTHSPKITSYKGNYYHKNVTMAGFLPKLRRLVTDKKIKIKTDNENIFLIGSLLHCNRIKVISNYKNILYKYVYK